MNERYWVCWQSRRKQKWCEYLRVKKPSKPFVDAYVEDLKTGDILSNLLSFRQVCEMKLRVQSDKFPKRLKALAAMRRKDAVVERAKLRKAQARSPEAKIKRLEILKKKWLRKFILANNKLKKVRRQLRRLQGIEV